MRGALTEARATGPSGFIRADDRTVVTFGRWYAEDLPGQRRLRVAVTGEVNWNLVGRHRLGTKSEFRGYLAFGGRDLVGVVTVTRQEPLEFRLEDFE